jgi:hypothetical protein
MEKLAMFKRHYRTAALVFLSLAAGSAAADAAETGIKTTPDSSKHTIAYRYDPHRPVWDIASPTIMPGRKQATAGMATSGILTPGAPGMATIEAAGIL